MKPCRYSTYRDGGIWYFGEFSRIQRICVQSNVPSAQCSWGAPIDWRLRKYRPQSGGKLCTRVLRLGPQRCCNSLQCLMPPRTGRKYWANVRILKRPAQCVGNSFIVVDGYSMPLRAEQLSSRNIYYRLPDGGISLNSGDTLEFHTTFTDDGSRLESKATRGGSFTFHCAGEEYEIKYSYDDTAADVKRRIQAALPAEARARVPGVYRETTYASGEVSAEKVRLACETIESRLRAQLAVAAWRKTPTGQFFKHFGPKQKTQFGNFPVPAKYDSNQAKLERAKAAMRAFEETSVFFRSCAEAQAFHRTSERIADLYARVEAVEKAAAPMWVDHKTRSYEPAYDDRHDDQLRLYHHGFSTRLPSGLSEGDVLIVQPSTSEPATEYVVEKADLRKCKGSAPGTAELRATVRCNEPLQQIVCKIAPVEEVEVKVEVF